MAAEEDGLDTVSHCL